MNNNLIQWRDPEALSKGFIIDLENGSAAQVFSGIYMRPEELISAFADCFLLMRLLQKKLTLWPMNFTNKHAANSTQ